MVNIFIKTIEVCMHQILNTLTKTIKVTLVFKETDKQTSVCSICKSIQRQETGKIIKIRLTEKRERVRATDNLFVHSDSKPNKWMGNSTSRKIQAANMWTENAVTESDSVYTTYTLGWIEKWKLLNFENWVNWKVMNEL